MAAEDLLESYDETMESYDESYDESSYDESLDAEFLGPLLGRAISGIGGALGTAGNVVGGLLGANQRPALPGLRVPFAGTGVGTATLNTPNGSATIRLPDRVVRVDDFKAATDRLQEAINRNTARLNSTQTDIAALSRRVGTVVEETRRETARGLAKVRTEDRRARAKMRRDQQQQNTMNLLMGMMSQRRLRDRLDQHIHAVSLTKDASNNLSATTAPAGAGSGGSDSMMMMLPLMMMGDMGGGGSGGGGDNPMMMMVMMMAMMDK